ncbi:uncharacterized protein B0P05DRAFT_524672 [Gilbertella persicaria]|uniref:uncharacterized protein n=1 Tax=Gilbertella persicaria TaxID=101096 RepID=UPI00221E85C0|nr:uncharacterized protein B0P05DRAFT_524672 [Gilbertella persicaria]KAI8095096.1 hypothetical protein B0P05DRAFT_524672 [Gilbertella persicaria]
MDHPRSCMSIHAIVDHEAPLSPPDSFKSRSPTLSPQMEYMPCPEERRRNSLQLPMSIEERRYRNKLASAKYRAKKQASMKSMTAKVSQLMASNSSLQRELSKVKQENEVLRAMLLNQQQQQLPSYSVPSPPHVPPASFY